MTASASAIPFPRLLRAEFRKAIDTRAARWLLAAAVLLALAAAAVPLVFPHNVSQDRASFLTWSALGLSRLLPIALMLTMTAEWSQRTALTTFTLEPRRGRVLAAKVVASLAISVVGGCLAFVIAQAGLAVALADGRHPAVGWSWPELAGFAAFVLLTSAIGSAIGSALHNTAAAIVTYFALAGHHQPAADPGRRAGRKLGEHRPDLRLDARRPVVRPRRPDSILSPHLGRPAPDDRRPPHHPPRHPLRPTKPAQEQGACRPSRRALPIPRPPNAHHQS